MPDEEKLALLPFKLGDLAGLRLVRVVPGVALQLTDGPKDTLDASEQAHLVISVAPGGPQQARDRDHFARARVQRPAAVQGCAHRQLGADAHRRPARP